MADVTSPESNNELLPQLIAEAEEDDTCEAMTSSKGSMTSLLRCFKSLLREMSAINELSKRVSELEVLTLTLDGSTKRLQGQVQSLLKQVDRLERQERKNRQNQKTGIKNGNSGNISLTDEYDGSLTRYLDVSGNSSGNNSNEMVDEDGGESSADNRGPKIIPRPSPATPRTMVMHINDFNRQTCSIKRIKAQNIIRSRNGSVITLNYHITKISFGERIQRQVA